MVKHLGLLSTALLTSGLLYVINKWPYGINRTFSQHIARYRSAIHFYFSLFAITLPILLVFFYGWFIPNFKLSIWFTILISLAAVFQLGCTLIPQSGGNKSKWHRALAFLSADMLLPAIIILAFNSALSPFATAVSVFASVGMLLIIAVMVKNNAEHKFLLLLQSGYFAMFFAAILAATYTS